MKVSCRLSIDKTLSYPTKMLQNTFIERIQPDENNIIPATFLLEPILRNVIWNHVSNLVKCLFCVNVSVHTYIQFNFISNQYTNFVIVCYFFA